MRNFRQGHFSKFRAKDDRGSLPILHGSDHVLDTPLDPDRPARGLPRSWPRKKTSRRLPSAAASTRDAEGALPVAPAADAAIDLFTGRSGSSSKRATAEGGPASEDPLRRSVGCDGRRRVDGRRPLYAEPAEDAPPAEAETEYDAYARQAWHAHPQHADRLHRPAHACAKLRGGPAGSFRLFQAGGMNGDGRLPLCTESPSCPGAFPGSGDRLSRRIARFLAAFRHPN